MGQLILGCHNLTGGSSYDRSSRLVRAALALGIKRFDVAPSYGLGTAEDTLSRALASNRFDTDIQIATKFGIPSPRFGNILSWIREPVRGIKNSLKAALPAASRDLPTRQSIPFKAHSTRIQTLGSAALSVDDSLRRLRVENIDCLLTHEFLPDRTLSDFGECAAKFVEQGKITKIGCSGELQFVKHNLDALALKATVAQLSMLDAREDLGRAELSLSHFHLSGFSRELGQRLSEKGFESLRAHLNDICGGQLDNDFLPLLAAGLSLSLQSFPDRAILVNASSDQRLETLIKVAFSNEYTQWGRAALRTGITN